MLYNKFYFGFKYLQIVRYARVIRSLLSIQTLIAIISQYCFVYQLHFGCPVNQKEKNRPQSIQTVKVAERIISNTHSADTT